MPPGDTNAGLLADLATGLWRLQRRFADGESGEVPEAWRRAQRDVEMLLARLKEEHVEIQDHTGSSYEPSQSLRVAAFQPTPGLEQDRIVETLKPTVYHREQRIQVGEVIVGIPKKKEDV
jgi:hypothetical protein